MQKAGEADWWAMRYRGLRAKNKKGLSVNRHDLYCFSSLRSDDRSVPARAERGARGSILGRGRARCGA